MKKNFICILSILMLTFLSKTLGQTMDLDFTNLELMISQDQIRSKIIETAEKIDDDYKDKEIIFLMIMKGAFVFTSDLIREIKTPFSVETVKCSSYGLRGKKRGNLTILGLDKLDLKDKHVIVVDDIFDSGATLSSVMDIIEQDKEPASLKSLILLVKDTKRRLKDVELPDYQLFDIEDKFVVGYGLDYKEYFRGLKGIYTIE